MTGPSLPFLACPCSLAGLREAGFLGFPSVRIRLKRFSTPTTSLVLNHGEIPPALSVAGVGLQRQGGGKGAPELWVAVVKPGKIMFEISGVHLDVAKEAVRLASHKLPIKTKFVYEE